MLACGHRVEVILRPFSSRAGLSARERDVVSLAVAGNWSRGQIAAKLRISERTVKFHVSSILRKTGAPNLPRLVWRLLRDALASGTLDAPGQQAPEAASAPADRTGAD